MYKLVVILCFATLLHSSVSKPTKGLKPKPVDLAYSCLKVSSGDTKAKDLTPVLLIHGLGSSKESWMGIYQLLAMRTNRKVCIADLRNHGDSPWSDETDVATMTEDISRLLGTLKAPKIILLGHSLGGKVAMHFTLNHPDKVEKLIVEDMRPNGLTKEALYSVKYFLTLLVSSIKAIPEGSDESTAKKAIGQFIKTELAKLSLDASGLVDEKFIDVLPIKCSDGKCRWKTNTKLIELVLKNMSDLLSESSGRFDGPTLFLYGTKSQFRIKEDETSILKLFPQAKLIGVEGATHMVHTHREFLDAVIKFINVDEKI